MRTPRDGVIVCGGVTWLGVPVCFCGDRATSKITGVGWLCGPCGDYAEHLAGYLEDEVVVDLVRRTSGVAA